MPRAQGTPFTATVIYDPTLPYTSECLKTNWNSNGMLEIDCVNIGYKYRIVLSYIVFNARCIRRTNRRAIALLS